MVDNVHPHFCHRFDRSIKDHLALQSRNLWHNAVGSQAVNDKSVRVIRSGSAKVIQNGLHVFDQPKATREGRIREGESRGKG